MGAAFRPAATVEKPLALQNSPELWWSLVGALSQSRAAALRSDMMAATGRDTEAEIASRDEDEATDRVMKVLAALQDRGELESACLQAELAEGAA